ncbi:hypothetical protein Glove_63g45 [Diversispora epigaea]|uniref:Uncharacterized protein n=1 Tax=Diversispora epigaea TaxID=1348612 RepID=A0A397JKG9_9GLOM|nr:hypothetical protein Glove_63g45 [Diversispora epigaea]
MIRLRIGTLCGDGIDDHIINSCPPPLLWIEVAFNKNDDRNNAINKVAYVQPYCPNTEFVMIIIPFETTAFPANKNLDAISIVVTPRSDRPFRAPYLGHLAVGNNIVQYVMESTSCMGM